MEVKVIAPYFEYMGFKAKELPNSLFSLEIPMQPHMLNEEGAVHPGVFSSMLDIIIGATLSRKYGSFAITINLNLSFFDLEPKSFYKAETTLIHRDGKFATGEGTVHDEQGRLVAKGIGSFKVG